jgi:hypothetical protein
MGSSGFQQNVINQSRFANECGDGDQGPFCDMGFRVESIRIYDLKIIEPHAGLTCEFVFRGGNQLGGIPFAGFEYFP